MKKLAPTHKMMNRVVLAIAVIFISLNGLAMAARTERGGWHDHAREAHAWRQQHWRHGQSIYGDGGYVTTYAPPVVVDPPPAYYGSEPGVNLVFPLNFR